MTRARAGAVESCALGAAEQSDERGIRARPARSAAGHRARGEDPLSRALGGGFFASCCGAVLLACALPLGAVARPGSPAFLSLDPRSAPTIPVSGPACEGGLRLDDGGFEGGVGWTNATLDGRYAMRFVPPAAGQVEAVCLCWTRSEFAALDALDFEILILADRGAELPPGDVLARQPVRAEGVPRFDQDGGRFYRYPLIQRVDGPFHVAVAWSPTVFRQFFLCNDAGPDTPLQPAWSSADGGLSWTAVVALRPSFRALGLRVEFAALLPEALPVPLAVWAPMAGLLALAGALALRRRLTASGHCRGPAEPD